MSFQRVVVTCLSVAVLSAGALAQGQGPLLGKLQPPPPAQKIREGVYRIGSIEVDTIKKEVRVAAIVNSDIKMLEWVANTKGGAKAYESALTVDASAATFNAALLLLGLDPSHSRVPTRHFDPIAPKGDPILVWLEWTAGTLARRVPIEELLYDERTKSTLTAGPWVYTGSAFSNGYYMAELDGVLIGFVHSPSPIIENPRAGAVNAFGSITMNNDRLGLPGGSKVTLVIQAVSPNAKGSK